MAAIINVLGKDRIFIASLADCFCLFNVICSLDDNFTVVKSDQRNLEGEIEDIKIYDPLLGFPCLFHVVPDYKTALKHLKIEKIDAIILPCQAIAEASALVASFSQDIAQSCENVPLFIHLLGHDAAHQENTQEDWFVRFTVDASVSLDDLTAAIVFSAKVERRNRGSRRAKESQFACSSSAVTIPGRWAAHPLLGAELVPLLLC